VSRLQTTFENLAREGRKALIPFITAGDPQPAFTVPMLHAMVAAGADIVELGVPFSDPMADGPVIQRAAERALAHHVSLRQVLEMVAEFRRRDDQTPVVLMGYLNPIECLGYQAFADLAKQAGVDGVLIVDLPPEEAEEEMLPLLYAAGVDPIFLLAPTSTPERIEKADRAGRGYLYYVSLKGVTGAAHLDIDDVARKVAGIKALSSCRWGSDSESRIPRLPHVWPSSPTQWWWEAHWSGRWKRRRSILKTSSGPSSPCWRRCARRWMKR